MLQTTRGPDPFSWAFPVSLGLFALGFAAVHAVNVPYWDEWEFTEVAAGIEPFTWNWVWTLHNGHLLVWQRLFTYAWARLTAWNVAAAVLFPALMICGGSLFLLRRELAKHADLPAGARRLFVAALALWLFSLRQHENLTWSFAFTWGVLFLIVIAFHRVWTAFRTEGRGGVLVAALLVLATFDNAAGLALDFYVIGHALVAALRRTLRARDAGLALLAGLLLSAYSIPRSMPGSFPNPLRAVGYGLVYAGNSVALLWPLAILFSLLSLCLLAAALRRRVAWADLYGERPLLVIGLFMMAMVTFGRVGDDIGDAAASRYSTISLLLQWDLWTFSFATLRPKLSPRALMAGLWAAFAIFLGGWSMGLAEATLVTGHRVRALEAFERCASAPGADLRLCPGEKVYPNREILFRRVRILREKRLCFFRSGLLRADVVDPEFLPADQEGVDVRSRDRDGARSAADRRRSGHAGDAHVRVAEERRGCRDLAAVDPAPIDCKVFVAAQVQVGEGHLADDEAEVAEVEEHVDVDRPQALAGQGDGSRMDVGAVERRAGGEQGEVVDVGVDPVRGEGEVAAALADGGSIRGAERRRRPEVDADLGSRGEREQGAHEGEKKDRLRFHDHLLSLVRRRWEMDHDISGPRPPDPSLLRLRR
jgi:hypothetical protein